MDNQIECESCGVVYQGSNIPTRLECLCKGNKFRIKAVKINITSQKKK